MNRATDNPSAPTANRRDPSPNVIALSEQAHRRQDDLRAANEKFLLAELRHVGDMAELRALHQRELDAAEAGRINAIRQVDREEVAKTSAQALTAVQALASTTNTIAETLRAQQATTTESQNKRISALELSASKGEGKSAGVNWVAVGIAGAVSMVAGVLGIIGVLYAVLNR